MRITALNSYYQNRCKVGSLNQKTSQTLSYTNTSQTSQIPFYPLLPNKANSIAFGVKVPFKNGYHCPCCDIKMLDPTKFHLPSKKMFPKASSIIKQIESKIPAMEDSETESIKLLKEMVKENPAATFDDLTQEMSDLPNRFKYFKNKISYMHENTYNKAIIDYLDNFKENMQPIEKEVFSRIKELQTQYPNKSIRDILMIMRPKHIDKLQLEQDGILSKIEMMSQGLSYKSAKKVKSFISNEKNWIAEKNDEDPFKRKKFIALLSNMIEEFDFKDIMIGKEMLKVAQTLPTSAENLNAFVVKYSGLTKKKRTGEMVLRSQEEIATRFVSPSFPTLEHIVPRNPIKGPKGETKEGNLIYECQRCNNNRGNEPFYSYIPRKHPNMPQYAQKNMDEIIDDINNDRFDRDYSWYPALIKEVFKDVSTNPASKNPKPLINLDISKLRKTPEDFVERLKQKYQKRKQKTV